MIGFEDDVKSDDENAPKSGFIVYLAEGDQLFRKREYKKALERYTTALDIEPSNKHALVQRSKCYQKLADAENALKDVEGALQFDNSFNDGLLAKSDALYALGHFEHALMFYHRGYKLRPEKHEFRLGIQKCHEAIDNAIGDPGKVKLTLKGDLTFLTKGLESKRRFFSSSRTETGARRRTTSFKGASIIPRGRSKRIAKHLLGELYIEKCYLENLKADRDLTGNETESSKVIAALVDEGLQYLDARTEFWRQQEPMYARTQGKRRAARSPRAKTTSPSKSRMVSPKGKRKRAEKVKIEHENAIKKLEQIDQLLVKGKIDKCLAMCETLLHRARRWPERENELHKAKYETIASIFSHMGNAYLEKERYSEAVEYHERDRETCEAQGLELQSKVRALDNIGRVHARAGRFEDAVDVWEESLEMPVRRQNLETCWLYHELARCYLEQEHMAECRHYAIKCKTVAENAGDKTWKVNAAVLMGQMLMKSSKPQQALDEFSAARDIAAGMGDEAALNAINEVIQKILKSESYRQLQLQKQQNTARANLAQGETMQQPTMEQTEPVSDSQAVTAEATDADLSSKLDRNRSPSGSPPAKAASSDDQDVNDSHDEDLTD